MNPLRITSRLIFASVWLVAACTTANTPAGANAQEVVEQQAVDRFSQTELMAYVCASCHHGANTAMPSLAGWSADAMSGALLGYRNSPSGTTVMHRIARGYGEEELREIALYLTKSEGGADAPSP